MPCCCCPCEIVVIGKAACAECLEKSRIECIEAYKKSMEVLNRNLVFCETPEEYKRNRNSYDYYRLEILYLTNAIPRPEKKKTRREKSNIFLN